MYEVNKKLILASGSPRRHSYLRDLGIAFEVLVADIDETPKKKESPLDYVERMAQEKCSAIMDHQLHSWVLAADTTVYFRDMILGKPVDEEDAVKILMTLSGRSHHVATSFVVGSQEKRVFSQTTTITKVTFAPFTQQIAQRYAATGEPMDKAGAYGIQGRGAFLVREIHGSYTNVVGLPMAEVLSVLNKYGIVKTKL